MRIPIVIGLCATLSLPLGSPEARAAGPAGIKTDGTVGPAAAVLTGPTYAIGQNLGKLTGGNLFFSFQYFNVATGETALFTTTSAGINNVVSRVTGGFASTIDGTIALHAAAGAPNFFLINPAGVTFTANALIDVPAVFAVGTADYVKFADGNFYANPQSGSTLSAAAPEAFGFLGTARAPVTLSGATLSGGNLGAGDVVIAAGDVTIDGAGVGGGIVNSTGNIRVAAVGAVATEVSFSGALAPGAGTVTLERGGILYTVDQGVAAGGGIAVGSGSLLIDGTGAAGSTGMLSFASGSGSAGPITVAVANDATLVNGGRILTGTFGSGAAGEVSVTASSLAIEGQSSALVTGIFADTFGAGRSGHIEVESQTLTVDGGTATNITGIANTAEVGSSGAGGDLAVTVTGAATLMNGGQIAAVTAGGGNAGNVVMSAQSLVIDGGSAALQTGISTSTYAAGNAGGIALTVGSIAIDGGTSTAFTGISTSTNVGSSATAGDISIVASGPVSIADGGQISSSTFGSGNGGNLSLTAASLAISGAATSGVTGIASETFGTGNAGNVSVSAPNVSITGTPANLQSGIAASSYGAGNPGEVSVNAGALTIDGGNTLDYVGIFSQTNDGSAAAAGDIAVTVSGAASIANGGEISSSTFGTRDAGNLSLSAASLSILGEAAIGFTGLFADTSAAGRAGSINVQTGSLTIDGGAAAGTAGIFSRALYGSSGAGGDLGVVVTGTASIINGGTVSSSTFASGNAGDVNLRAAGLTIDGGATSNFTGIASDAQGATGSAGHVTVTVSGAATLSNGGEISSSTFGAGSGGSLQLELGSLSIDGGTSETLTGVLSQANAGSTGAAGNIAMDVAGQITIANGGAISSETFGIGNAGQLNVTADSVALGGAGSAIVSSAELGSTGAAGSVTVIIASAASISSGAEIASSTFGTGNAGHVTVDAATLSIDGGNEAVPTGIVSQANPQATGSAGDVTMNVSGDVSITSGAAISSSTFGTGSGGKIDLTAGSLSIDGAGSPHSTGIQSSAQAGSSGPAGSVIIDIAGAASITDGGIVSTKTFGAGSAGDVTLAAGSLSVGGGSGTSSVTSAAIAGSGGQTGHITIDTGALAIDPHGAISISNGATVTDPNAIKATDIIIGAQSIIMNDGLITAASTGNVAASAIDVTYAALLRVDPSTISTASNDGNGGPITITGSGPLFVSHSNITTSVGGTHNGNGGNIVISAPEIVLDTGAIQANTFAPLASGGTVTINSAALVPSFESFVLGGNAVTFIATADGLNVVQAAAPDGVSGRLDVAVPILYLGNSLVGLVGRPYAPPPLARGPCGYTRGSSLAVSGRGGLPESAFDPLWVDSPDAPASGAQARDASPASMDLGVFTACR